MTSSSQAAGALHKRVRELVEDLEMRTRYRHKLGDSFVTGTRKGKETSAHSTGLIPLGHYTCGFLNSAAMPWPPPMHIEVIPYLTLFLRI